MTRLVTEFRDGATARRLAKAIAAATTRPWTIMEVCGGQTHAIMRHGLDKLLPPEIELCHGPGCPVCVTPAEAIDAAIALAGRPGVILATFGDMMRVPGEDGDLIAARARGADVRVVHGPLDAVALAAAEPGRVVVFFAIGFETTAPAIALATRRARDLRLENFCLLTALVLAPPAMSAKRLRTQATGWSPPASDWEKPRPRSTAPPPDWAPRYKQPSPR